MSATKTIAVPCVERFLLLSQDETPMPPASEVEERDYSSITPVPVRWDVVGRLVSRYGHALAAGTLGYFNDDEKLVFDVDTEGLSVCERDLVVKWFGEGESPRVSAENEGITDGRHRLASCWNADPSLLLPIHSELFMNASEVPHQGPEFAGLVRESMEAAFKNLPLVVQRRNARFMAQVQAYLDGTWDTSRGHWVSYPAA